MIAASVGLQGAQATEPLPGQLAAPTVVLRERAVTAMQASAIQEIRVDTKQLSPVSKGVATDRLVSSRAVVLAALTLFLAMPAALADVLVANVSQPTRGTSIIDSGLWAAQSFVTGAEAVRFQGIEIPVGLAEAMPSNIAELHADAGPALIGANLASLQLPVLSTGALHIEPLPAMPAVNLAPGTTYWVVLGVAGSGSFGWSYAEGNAMSGPGTLANYGYSYDAGATWFNYGNLDPYHMRVNVSAVPEPATAAMYFTGLLAVMSYYRRRGLASGSPVHPAAVTRPSGKEIHAVGEVPDAHC